MDIISLTSVIITGIISALSLGISILTLILNNRHQKKMKILDIIYDKKYKNYQKFFEIYAEYYANKKFDNIVLSDTITKCFLTTNQATTKHLISLLRCINDQIDYNKIHIEKEKLIDRYFINCINSMKDELNLS